MLPCFEIDLDVHPFVVQLRRQGFQGRVDDLVEGDELLPGRLGPSDAQHTSHGALEALRFLQGKLDRRGELVRNAGVLHPPIQALEVQLDGGEGGPDLVRKLRRELPDGGHVSRLLNAPKHVTNPVHHDGERRRQPAYLVPPFRGKGRGQVPLRHLIRRRREMPQGSGSPSRQDDERRRDRPRHQKHDQQVEGPGAREGRRELAQRLRGNDGPRWILEADEGCDPPTAFVRIGEPARSEPEQARIDGPPLWTEQGCKGLAPGGHARMEEKLLTRPIEDERIACFSESGGQLPPG